MRVIPAVELVAGDLVAVRSKSEPSTYVNVDGEVVCWGPGDIEFMRVGAVDVHFSGVDVCFVGHVQVGRFGKDDFVLAR